MVAKYCRFSGSTTSPKTKSSKGHFYATCQSLAIALRIVTKELLYRSLIELAIFAFQSRIKIFCWLTCLTWKSATENELIKSTFQSNLGTTEQANKHTNKQTNTHPNKQTHKQTNKHTHKQTNTQTNKQSVVLSWRDQEQGKCQNCRHSRRRRCRHFWPRQKSPSIIRCSAQLRIGRTSFERTNS